MIIAKEDWTPPPIKRATPAKQCNICGDPAIVEILNISGECKAYCYDCAYVPRIVYVDDNSATSVARRY